MDRSGRVNRGLRYLSLDHYSDSSPELVTANITKLRLLQSLDLNVVHLPTLPGCPHDGAVRVPQDESQPERLIWFDFMVLLEDEHEVATRYGTITMDEAGSGSSPAFYVVTFPNTPGHMAIVPHAIAWAAKESGSYDIIGTGITGASYVYGSAKDLDDTLGGALYKPWHWRSSEKLVSTDDRVTERFASCPSAPRALPSNSAGKKRRRESESEEDFGRMAPALRTTAPIHPVDFTQPGFDASWTDQDFFSLDWLSTEPTLSVLPGTAYDTLHGIGPAEAQQSEGYIQPAPPESGDLRTDTRPANNELTYMGYDLSWMDELESDKAFAGSNIASILEGATAPNARWLLPATQVGPATTSFAVTDVRPYEQVVAGGSGRSIGPVHFTPEAGPSHISTAAVPVDAPSNARSSSIAVPSSKCETEGSESDSEDEEDVPRRLIELSPDHPWSNHIYLPPSTQDVLTQLLAPDTICLPVITNPSDSMSKKPMPLSVLSISHPCLHVLSSRFKPDTFFLIPSRWVDAFHSHLNQLLNSTQGESKKSALRGKHKVVTENPTVKDALDRYGVRGIVGAEALSEELWRKFSMEAKRQTPIGMTREEDRNACCSVREVLQIQVDWSMRDMG
ncbi:hypothetical protein E4T43_02287 [Aureobasidium subglaciale]|nr:hypothetical protein E4T43_02287 [Aureobasidium subglaciale]